MKAATHTLSHDGNIRKRKFRSWNVFFLFLLNVSSSFWLIRSQDNDKSNEGEIRVVVEFRTLEEREAYWDSMLSTNGYNSTRRKARSTFSNRRDLSEQTEAYKRHQYYQFKESNMVAMTVSPHELRDLQALAAVSGIEEDTKMYLYQSESEILPYGIVAVQGTSNVIPRPTSETSDCSSPDSFKVCVVDSGLLVAHKDIPYNRGDPSIMGKVFGLSEDLKWFNPTAASFHGTHVTGTIVAEANNGFGVAGVVPSPDGVCLMVGRAFGAQGVQSSSFVAQAIDWCVNNGAKVVNLSLGSAGSINGNERKFYDSLYEDRGVLTVAAAGNAGTSELSYPASLDSVISVGSVNEDNARGDFSQFNSELDFVAPGVNILSTTSGSGFRLDSRPNQVLRIELMASSAVFPLALFGQSLELVDCNFGLQVCQNAQGKVCLISRGGSLFFEKALVCQESGGAAAFVYNDQPGTFNGSVELAQGSVRIPTFSVPRQDGLFMLQDVARFAGDVGNGQKSTIRFEDNMPSYSYLSGTSMSAPHVTGVIAKIWAARPACTNAQIRRALEFSALDLGPDGRDDEYGFGLVQAEAAYRFLIDEMPPPCGVVVEEAEMQQEDIPDTVVAEEEENGGVVDEEGITPRLPLEEIEEEGTNTIIAPIEDEGTVDDTATLPTIPIEEEKDTIDENLPISITPIEEVPVGDKDAAGAVENDPIVPFPVEDEEPVAGQANCRPNFQKCAFSSQCCSGRCQAVFHGGTITRQCRTVPKAVKAKIGNRGGVGGNPRARRLRGLSLDSEASSTTYVRGSQPSKDQTWKDPIPESTEPTTDSLVGEGQILAQVDM